MTEVDRVAMYWLSVNRQHPEETSLSRHVFRRSAAYCPRCGTRSVFVQDMSDEEVYPEPSGPPVPNNERWYVCGECPWGAAADLRAHGYDDQPIEEWGYRDDPWAEVVRRTIKGEKVYLQTWDDSGPEDGDNRICEGDPPGL